MAWSSKSFSLGIIGETGQLAQALAHICQKEDINTYIVGRDSLDLSSDDNEIQLALKAFDSVGGIINAAAYTAVDAAEDDEGTAYRVNANAPKLFAEYCKNRDIPLVHISTDYVFSGQNTSPYEPQDKTDPLGVYGQTKRQGETFVQASGANHAILRTSWVYNGTGKNFLTTMLRLGATRDTLSVVNDQFGRPTFSYDLARAALAAIKKLSNKDENLSGTYHVSNKGPVISWADFARAIFDAAATDLPHIVHVTGIPSSEYPTRAKRPAYSALDVSKFEDRFDFQLPDWSKGLNQAIADWKNNKS